LGRENNQSNQSSIRSETPFVFSLHLSQIKITKTSKDEEHSFLFPENYMNTFNHKIIRFHRSPTTITHDFESAITTITVLKTETISHKLESKKFGHSIQHLTSQIHNKKRWNIIESKFMNTTLTPSANLKIDAESK